MILMIENYRTGLIWNIMRRSPLRRGRLETGRLPGRMARAMSPLDDAQVADATKSNTSRESAMVPATVAMNRTILDQFQDLSGWGAVASGQAELSISQDRGPARQRDAPRLSISRAAAASWSPASRSCCRYRRPTRSPSRSVAPRRRTSSSSSWSTRRARTCGGFSERRSTSVRTGSRFGSAAARSSLPGDPPAAGHGGGRRDRAGHRRRSGRKGTVWMAICVSRIAACVDTPSSRRRAAACRPRSGCVSTYRATSWRSTPSAAPQWLLIDFQEEREYGGLIVDWDPRPGARRFDVQTVDDASTWKTRLLGTTRPVTRSYVYLPERLALSPTRSCDDAGRRVRHHRVEVKPFEFSRSHRGVLPQRRRRAARAPIPKYLYAASRRIGRRSASRTAITCALLNEEGMVEVDKGTFSIEPFLLRRRPARDVGRRDVDAGARGRVPPVPSSVWRGDDIVLRTTAFATAMAGRPVLYMRYRSSNGAVARTRAPVRCRASLPGDTAVAGVRRTRAA